MLDAIYSHIRDKTQTKRFSPFTFSRHLATMLIGGLKKHHGKDGLFARIFCKVISLHF